MENIVNIQDHQEPGYPALAAEKIAAELKGFTGGSKEKAISKFAAETLIHFCEESPQFAQVVYKTRRTLSDCCAEVMKGTGNAIHRRLQAARGRRAAEPAEALRMPALAAAQRSRVKETQRTEEW